MQISEAKQTLSNILSVSGTSMISLAIPFSKNIVCVMQFLRQEVASATNIKSRV